MKKKKALIAMSGGVDSSVAAMLTQEAGYECIGCTMRLYDGTGGDGGGCCTLDDAEDARAVAYRLGMPHYTFNMTEAFRREVIDRFAEQYRQGLTPNPCIDCNRCLKFDALLCRARELGCDCLVTGHYATIEREGERYTLRKATDARKDQSYVLYMLGQEALSQLRFPLGALSKEEVRARALASGFRNASKPDSQDICFAPTGDYAAVIESLDGISSPPGNFVDQAGRVLGTHRGLIRYTVGQHRGLGLGWHEPLYVLSLDAARNEVVLGPKEALYRDRLTAAGVSWVADSPPPGPLRCLVKCRYRQTEQNATVTPLEGGERVEVVFDEPQRALTPGQSAVFYDEAARVLGGGIIEREE